MFSPISRESKALTSLKNEWWTNQKRAITAKLIA